MCLVWFEELLYFLGEETAQEQYLYRTTLTSALFWGVLFLPGLVMPVCRVYLLVE